jgi:hypothetical protein
MEPHRPLQRRLVAMDRFPHKIGRVPILSVADPPLHPGRSAYLPPRAPSRPPDKSDDQATPLDAAVTHPPLDFAHIPDIDQLSNRDPPPFLRADPLLVEENKVAWHCYCYPQGRDRIFPKSYPIAPWHDPPARWSLFDLLAFVNELSDEWTTKRGARRYQGQGPRWPTQSTKVEKIPPTKDSQTLTTSQTNPEGEHEGKTDHGGELEYDRS